MPNPYDAISLSDAPEKTAGNPYDAILQNDEATLRGSLVNALQANPDQAAKAARLARQVGAPPSAVEANLPEVEAGFKIDHYAKMIERAPKTGDLLRNPDVARMAHDDVDNLVRSENVLKSWGGPEASFSSVTRGLLRALPQGLEMARQGIRQQFAEAFGLSDMATDAARRYAQANASSVASTPEFESTTARGLYGGASSLLQNIPGMVASILTRSPAPVLATMGLQTEAQAYGKYRGRGASGGMAALGAVGEGGVEVATEMLPMWFLINRFGKAGVGEFLAGFLAREIPGEQLATFLQDALDTAIANPEKTWGEFAAERPERAYETLLATAVQSGAMGALHAVATRAAGREVQAHQAAQSGELLAGMNRLAEASKVRARDPETAQAFFQSVLADGNDSVWITADALAQSGLAEQMARAIPAVAEQLETAAASGHDIRIPVADLLANMAGPELEQALLPHVATTPGGFTPTTAQEYLQSGQADELRSEMSRLLGAKEQDDAFQASAQEVEDAVFAELQSAGRHAESVNRADAMLHRHFFSVMAAKVGETPKALFDRYALKVVAEGLAGQKFEQPDNPDILHQPARGTFTPSTNTIALLKDANLSTFLHESGHFFLEVQTAIAAEISNTAAVHGADTLTDGERGILADTRALMNWFGLEDLNAWGNLDFEQKRSYHEQLARGFEAYLFEGKSPSIEMQGLFQRFSAWLLRVYKSLKALNVDLTDEVRGVFDRMLATDEQIQLAEQGRAMIDLFQSGEQSGMTPEAFASYQALGKDATEAAKQELRARGLRDLQWIKNAKSREITRLRVESRARRSELEIAARREIMSQPVYRAWQFLTDKLGKDDMMPIERAMSDYRDALKAWNDKRSAAEAAFRSSAKQEVWEASEEGRVKYRRPGTLAKAQARVLRREDGAVDAMVEKSLAAWEKTNRKPIEPTDPSARPKLDPNQIDESRDSLFVAIAKLGGINKAEVVSTWGTDPADRPTSGVFGKPVWRRDGGLSIDGMAEALSQYGYLPVNEHGQWDLRDFEGLFDRELKGEAQYSTSYDVGAARRPPKPGEELANPAGLRAARLNVDWLADTTLTREQIALLKKRRMTSRNGLHPDVVADLFDEFDSGDALVQALAAATPPKEMIDALVDQRMLEQYGEMATTEAIEKAADSAIFNEARARAIATELSAMDAANRVRADAGKDSAGRQRTYAVLPAAAKEFAAALMGRLRIRDIIPGQYASASTRAARDAIKAEKSGDIEAAAAAKRTQLLNHYTTRAAYDAQEEFARADAFFKSIIGAKDESIRKSRDFDLVSAARAVLAAYGYGGKARAATEYVNRVNENDPTWMADVIRKAVEEAEVNGKPIRDLTLEELRGLRDEVAGLWHLAQRNRQMEIDGKLLDRDVVADALIHRMKDIGIPKSAPGESSAVTPEEEVSMRICSAKAIGRRVESWVDQKDGHVKIGVFRRYVWLPIKEAADRYRAEKVQRLRDFREAFSSIAPTMKRGLIAAPEIGYTFGKDSGGVAMNELLHAILHTGNASNQRKLLLGRGWATLLDDGTIDTSRWDAFVDRMQRSGVLTQVHYDFAQAVWDQMESMKPAAQRAHRDATGQYFEEVTANAFDTPWGKYRGGYVPAKVDGRIVQDMALKKLIEEGAEGMSYTFPSAPKGFTKSRVEYNKPLLLDLRLLPQHIDSVLLFTHLELPVRDAARLLGFAPVRDALDRQDPEAINTMLIPWLNRSARQQVITPVPGAGWMVRFLNGLRNRTGMAYMFANLSNAAQQISGFPMALVKVKASSLALATAQYLKAPRQTAAEVSLLSPYMERRMDHEVAAMRGEVEAILLDPTLYERAQEWTNRHAYFLQSAVDNVMGPVVWKAAYDEALSEAWDTRDAARIADAVIRQTQGSTLPEDVSRLETGPAYARLFTQFAGYFNMQANLLGAELGKVTQDIGLKKGAGRALFVLLAGFCAPALVAELVYQLFKGGPSDDDRDGSYLDDWLMALFVYGPMRNVTAMVPFAGQAINSAMARFTSNPMDDRVSVAPIVGAIDAGAGVPYDAYRAAIGEGNAARSIKDVATLVSLVTGLPANAVARPISYLAGVAQGNTNPTGPFDVARGMATGAASPESRGR